MERFRQLREKSKVVRVLTNKYIVTTVIFILLMLFVKNNNIVQFFSDYIHIYEQEKAIRQYEEKIRITEKELNQLTSDKDSLETFAREQYYFHNEGEDVFIIEKSR